MLLSPHQFGFHKNLSALDPLLRLSNQTQPGFAKECQTINVFFDLEKAYDTTWGFVLPKNYGTLLICFYLTDVAQFELEVQYLFLFFFFFFTNGNTERAQCALSRVCIP